MGNTFLCTRWKNTGKRNASAAGVKDQRLKKKVAWKRMIIKLALKGRNRYARIRRKKRENTSDIFEKYKEYFTFSHRYTIGVAFRRWDSNRLPKSVYLYVFLCISPSPLQVKNHWLRGKEWYRKEADHFCDPRKSEDCISRKRSGKIYR